MLSMPVISPIRKASTLDRAPSCHSIACGREESRRRGGVTKTGAERLPTVSEVARKPSMDCLLECKCLEIISKICTRCACDVQLISDVAMLESIFTTTTRLSVEGHIGIAAERRHSV